MHYMVFLAIENEPTFSIVLVGAPLALTRGGASTGPSTLAIIAHLSHCFQYFVGYSRKVGFPEQARAYWRSGEFPP